MQLQAHRCIPCGLSRASLRQCRLSSALAPQHRASRSRCRFVTKAAATLDRTDRQSASPDSRQTYVGRQPCLADSASAIMLLWLPHHGSDVSQRKPAVSRRFSFRDDEDVARQSRGQEATSSSQAESLGRGTAPHSGQFLGLDKGVWVAAGLLTAWATMIHITVFHTPLGSLQSYLLFWPMMQLHTG